MNIKSLLIFFIITLAALSAKGREHKFPLTPPALGATIGGLCGLCTGFTIHKQKIKLYKEAEKNIGSEELPPSLVSCLIAPTLFGALNGSGAGILYNFYLPTYIKNKKRAERRQAAKKRTAKDLVAKLSGINPEELDPEAKLNPEEKLDPAVKSNLKKGEKENPLLKEDLNPKGTKNLTGKSKLLLIAEENRNGSTTKIYVQPNAKVKCLNCESTNESRACYGEIYTLSCGCAIHKSYINEIVNNHNKGIMRFATKIWRQYVSTQCFFCFQKTRLPLDC